MPSKIRKQIVEQAVRCFARHGYHGATTKKIAKRADVTEGSLFRLFISKDKLFTEALTLALASKNHSRTHLRLAAFAMLERKGLNDSNLKALRLLAASVPLIKELQDLYPVAVR
jgi:AcrR family transcriptional regulator